MPATLTFYIEGNPEFNLLKTLVLHPHNIFIPYIEKIIRKKST